MTQITDVEILSSPVELYKILKFEGIAASGADAKIMIVQGLVSVNNEVETRKRRKIVAGDTIQCNDTTLKIVDAAEPKP